MDFMMQRTFIYIVGGLRDAFSLNLDTGMGRLTVEIVYEVERRVWKGEWCIDLNLLHEAAGCRVCRVDCVCDWIDILRLECQRRLGRWDYTHAVVGLG